MVHKKFHMSSLLLLFFRKMVLRPEVHAKKGDLTEEHFKKQNINNKVENFFGWYSRCKRYLDYSFC